MTLVLGAVFANPFLQLTNGLECYITLGCKHLPGTNIVPYWSLWCVVNAVPGVVFTNFFFMHINGLDLCILQGSKGLPVTNTLAYWHIYKLWSVANTGPGTASTRHFCNFKWPRVLHYKRLENLASDKHSSFLGPSPRGMVCTNANCSNNQIHWDATEEDREGLGWWT